MVGMIARNRVKPGKWDDVIKALQRVTVPALSKLPGYRSIHVLAGAHNEYTALVLWDSRAEGDAWVASPDRKKVLDALAPGLEGAMQLEWHDVRLVHSREG